MSLDVAIPAPLGDRELLDDREVLERAKVAWDARYNKLVGIRGAIMDRQRTQPLCEDIYELVDSVKRTLADKGIYASAGEIRLEISGLRQAGLVTYSSDKPSDLKVPDHACAASQDTRHSRLTNKRYEKANQMYGE